MELSFNAEKFIKLIEDRPSIWNYRSPAYSEKERRQNDWEELCKTMVHDYDQKTTKTQRAIQLSFQKQWKVFRDGYLRALKNIRKGSTRAPYIYHREMKFMIELYDYDGNVQKPSADSDAETSDTELRTAVSSVDPDTVPIFTRMMRKRSHKRINMSVGMPKKNTSDATVQGEMLEKIAEFIESETIERQALEQDEDKLFLLSLLNDFKAIHEDLKLEAKIEILNAIKKYKNKEGDSSQSQAATWCLDKLPVVSTTEANETETICYVKCEEDSDED